MSICMTEQEFAAMTRKMNKVSARNIPAPEKKQQNPYKRAKYGNHKVYVYEDGYVSEAEKAEGHGKLKCLFDSVREYKRWGELQLMERFGQITDLKRQVKLTVLEGFETNGETIRPIIYVADHMYTENGRVVVEDVKGLDKNTGRHITTKEFDIKWKLLKNRYREYQFKLY